MLYCVLCTRECRATGSGFVPCTDALLPLDCETFFRFAEKLKVGVEE